MTPTQVQETPNQSEVRTNRISGFLDWVLSIVIIFAASIGVYWIGYKTVSVRWGFRWGFCSAIGGLIVYVLLAIIIPDSVSWKNQAGWIGLVIFILIGCVLGWMGGYLWHQRKYGIKNKYRS